jgi:iron complex transport system ATP-binding protein
MDYFTQEQNDLSWVMKNDKKILELRDVSLGYNTRKNTSIILNAVNGSASDGEMISVIGANGVGKSTLLRSIIGLQKPLDGSIYLDGRDVSVYSQSQLARYFSYVSASSTSSSNLTVYELVTLGRFPHTNWIGRLKPVDRDIIEASIENVGLASFRNRKLNEMSDGERQRAMIARALAQDTRFIVLDEPTAYLDLPNKYELIYLLRSIVELERKTVIYTTHDLHIAIGESDKIWLLGKSDLFEGAPEDLMKEGRFADLFSNSKLEFADESGLYIYPAKTIGSLRFVFDKELEKITKRALLRLKIDISEDKNMPLLEARGDYKTACWSISNKSEQSLEFNKLYTLSAYLRKELFKSHSS